MTGQQYRLMFNHLVQYLDPEYPIGLTQKFEEECMPALKAFRYPYAHTVDNKWLSAPASMHCWPALLGVLSWFVEMCIIKSEYAESKDPALLELDSVPEQFDHPLHHVALASYLNAAGYDLWMSQEDEEFVAPRQFVEDRYALKDEKAKEENSELAQKYKAIQKELEQLRSSATPLVDLQKTNDVLRQDDQKFDTILKKYEAAIKKKSDQLLRDKEDYAKAEIQLAQMHGESQRLALIVETQNLSQQEVIKMNTDHETLARTLDDLKQRVADAQQTAMKLEVSIANRASKAEDELETYTSLLSSLNMFPPLPPPFDADLDLSLELNTAAANPAELLVGQDIRKVVRPAILKFAEMKRMARAEVGAEQLKVENELDKLESECERLGEAIEELERNAEHVSEQADDIKEASSRDAMISAGEAEKFERELARVRNLALSSGLGVRTQLQAAQFAAREQEDRINRLKQETISAVVQNGSHIANWKDSIAKHLSDVRACAEAEES